MFICIATWRDYQVLLVLLTMQRWTCVQKSHFCDKHLKYLQKD